MKRAHGRRRGRRGAASRAKEVLRVLPLLSPLLFHFCFVSHLDSFFPRPSSRHLLDGTLFSWPTQDETRVCHRGHPGTQV